MLIFDCLAFLYPNSILYSTTIALPPHIQLIHACLIQYTDVTVSHTVEESLISYTLSPPGLGRHTSGRSFVVYCAIGIAVLLFELITITCSVIERYNEIRGVRFAQAERHITSKGRTLNVSSTFKSISSRITHFLEM